jgi:hypothetical protein
MTVGIIPLDDYLRLFEILEAVEPIYDELVWNPFYGQAQTRLTALKAYADQMNLGAMLGPIARFLNSSWTAKVGWDCQFKGYNNTGTKGITHMFRTRQPPLGLSASVVRDKHRGLNLYFEMTFG